MKSIQLSYLLYNIDEVKYSFMLSILFQNNHTLKECLFWAYELYQSKYHNFIWNFITKIYYDFYYIKGASFERQIDKEHHEWLKTNDFKHIAKIVKELHKQTIDITIFQYYYRSQNNIPNNTDPIQHKDLKKNIPNTIQYLKTVDMETIKLIYKKLYRLNDKKDICLFYDNQHHKWMVKLVCRFIKTKKIWIKTKLNTEDDETINLFQLPATRVYKTLHEKRKYQINTNIGAFQLARFKQQTDVVKLWDKSLGYTYDDVDRYISAYLHNWEYYAYQTPFWKEIFDKHKVSFKKKQIKFPNNDLLESFYDTYGFEPDEQSNETHQKSIIPINPTTITKCFELYKIPLNETIKQINYCV